MRKKYTTVHLSECTVVHTIECTTVYLRDYTVVHFFDCFGAQLTASLRQPLGSPSGRSRCRRERLASEDGSVRPCP